jgi:single-stranded-DNA-specific exonuclease
MKWEKRKAILKPRGSDGIIQQLARIRGIKDIQEFLNPTEKHLHNPLLLKNIREACDRILDAVMKGQKIVVSADCDTDGIMSTAMMVRFLRQFTDNVSYIYNQRSSGHGIENQLEFVPDDTELLIILDSSSDSIKACKELHSKGIDIIILDHHQVEVQNDFAILVNPQNDDYPNKSISGAGVTFKTIQLLDEKLGTESYWDLIDLCAIGMYADMMDCSVMENRYLIIQGMKNINNPGIRAILDVKNTKIEDVNSQTIGFTIAPMINGSARLDKIELALELVLSDDYSECLYLAEEIDKLNEDRKKTQKFLATEYSKTIDPDMKVIIAVDENASKSYNGLVATKLADEYKKPAMVLRKHKGSLAGSYRNYGDFDMQSFLRKFKHIDYAKGHPFAGGVRLLVKDYDKLLEYIDEELKGVNFDSVIEYDLELSVSDINEHMIIQVEKFDYLTGTGFPSACFRVVDLVYDTDARKIIGKSKNTLKIALDDVTIMRFNVTEDYASDIPDMSNIEVVGQLNLNIWQGFRGEVRTNQVFIEDYHIV